MPELLEVNDSEILKIEGVLKKLQERQGYGTNLEGFRKEAVERFRAIGFDVNVRVYETDEAGLYAFDLDLVGRVAGEFDPEQQTWEATNDILGLGTKGVIKTDGGILPGS